MNVGIRQLRAFCAVARLGNFTRAANALHTTQPALSLQIAQLEDALGLRLFDRTTRSVAITSTGRELLARAERTLAELSALVESAAHLGARDVGRVTVAALPTVASTVLPEAIASFAAAFPGIAVELRDALGGQIAEWVRDDQVDLGVTAEATSDPTLRFAAFGSDEMVAVTRADHPLSRTKRVTLGRLAQHPLILMSRQSSVRRLVDQAFAEARHLAQPVQEPVYMSTAIALVRAGVGVAIIPSSASELRGVSGLRVHRIAHSGMARPVGILTKRGRSLSPAAQEFERWLVKTAKRGRAPRPSPGPSVRPPS